MIPVLYFMSLVHGEQRLMDQDDQKGVAQVCRPSLII